MTTTNESDREATLRARIVAAIADYGNAVMDSTKRDGTSKTLNCGERVAARDLLKVLFPGQKPTEEEVDQIIPG